MITPHWNFGGSGDQVTFADVLFAVTVTSEGATSGTGREMK